MGTDNTILSYNNGSLNPSRYHNSIMINHLSSNHLGNSSLNYQQSNQQHQQQQQQTWQQSTSGGGVNAATTAACHLYYQQQQWAKYYGHSNPKRYYHHRHFAGKNLKEGSSGDEKKDDSNDGLWANVEAQAAFLGPNLWDKNLPYDADLKVGAQYVDLDEFLSENGIPLDQPSPTPSATATSSASASPPVVRSGGSDEGGGEGPSHHHQHHRRSLASELHVSVDSSSDCTKRERSQSPYDPPLSPSTVGPPSPTDSTMSFSSNTHDFDPRTRAFSDEELKPQPMIKKSRKQFVPDDLKDEKYWARRRKNNMAAKRSRDARRVKENQIALRAGFLEKENSTLRSENDRLKKENSLLRSKLEKLTKGN